MFIELHKIDGYAITINLDKLEYFVLAREDNYTMVSLPNYNGWLQVEEPYEQVKELIKKCQMK